MNTWLTSDGKWVDPETCGMTCDKCGEFGFGGVLQPDSMTVVCNECSKETTNEHN